mgnify:CR=1 FL=1
MPLSKYFRLEALTLIAFLATIPIYSPNHLLFETGVFDVPTFMAPFANTMLFSTLVLGTLAALASGRRCPERLLGRGWVVAGVAAYLTGYGLLIAAAALQRLGTGAVGALSGFLLAAGTVELAVLWGSYMAAYDLRQALLWCALSVGCAALVGLLVSSATFGVWLIVFVVLVLASFFVGVYFDMGYIHIADMIAGNADEEGVMMAFITLNMVEIFHCFNMRSRRASLFSMKKQNKWLWASAALALSLIHI